MKRRQLWAVLGKEHTRQQEKQVQRTWGGNECLRAERWQHGLNIVSKGHKLKSERRAETRSHRQL